jgi:hypothetical protein
VCETEYFGKLSIMSLEVATRQIAVNGSFASLFSGLFLAKSRSRRGDASTLPTIN